MRDRRERSCRTKGEQSRLAQIYRIYFDEGIGAAYGDATYDN